MQIEQLLDAETQGRAQVEQPRVRGGGTLGVHCLHEVAPFGFTPRACVGAGCPPFRPGVTGNIDDQEFLTSTCSQRSLKIPKIPGIFDHLVGDI